MAILAFDGFETVLEAPCADVDDEITIPAAAAAELFSLARLTYDAQVWGGATQRLIRVPMFLADGVHVERIELPLPAVEGGPTPVLRGATRYSFAAGAAVRCSPSALHVMQGHAGVQELAGVSQALVVPGELVAVGEMAAATFTLQFPDPGGSPAVAHMGELWPAEVLLTISTVSAVTVAFKCYDLLADAAVLLSGVSGLQSSVVLPAGTAFALFRIRRLPIGLPPYGIRGYYGWLVSVETWA
ncbi:hypothetical protein [Zoogloea sp.]|uniref:hypothetical protein n=1 Tax=Zoogloea sp. TaxID=49181 RepID=UPI001AD2FC83|nr:hypothetical protein [Zoogloea sp.]MBN8285367.1 hypothetical protein [Zoogloea sp.]